MNSDNDILYSNLIKILGEDNVKKSEPMKNHTTFRIGGDADLFATPVNAEQDEKNLECNIEVPNLIGLSCEKAEKKLKEAGLRMLVQGGGEVVAQVPAAGSMVYSNTEILITGKDSVDSYTDILAD